MQQLCSQLGAARTTDPRVWFGFDLSWRQPGTRPTHTVVEHQKSLRRDSPAHTHTHIHMPTWSDGPQQPSRTLQLPPKLVVDVNSFCHACLQHLHSRLWASAHARRLFGSPGRPCRPAAWVSVACTTMRCAPAPSKLRCHGAAAMGLAMHICIMRICALHATPFYLSAVCLFWGMWRKPCVRAVMLTGDVATAGSAAGCRTSLLRLQDDQPDSSASLAGTNSGSAPYIQLVR